MNRIRRRTIKALSSRGIVHELILIPTQSLLDKVELRVESPTQRQIRFVAEYFIVPRFYKVKVSQYGSADVSVSAVNVVVVGAKDRKLS